MPPHNETDDAKGSKAFAPTPTMTKTVAATTQLSLNRLPLMRP